MFTRTKNLNISLIKQIELQASKIPNAISLAQGIPSFETPEIIKQKAIEGLRNHKVSKYSLVYGLPELREIIGHDLMRQKMNYDYEKEIIVTCGAIEAISATLSTILDYGDEVIIPSPSYASYPEVIKFAGGVPVYFNLDEENGWAFDLEKFKQAITPKTKAFLFSNPHNPTGTIFTKEQLLEIVKLAREHNFYIISDEVYKDFIYDDTTYFSLAELSEYRDIVIRVFSFSKAYAMTGWRVGYLHSDKKIVDEIIKTHDSMVTCAPVISQYAAMSAITDGQADVVRIKNEFNRMLDLICSRLDNLKHIFSYQKPNSSYFVFPRIIHSDTNSKKFAIMVLEETGVAFVPGIAFGPSGEAHVRINFGREEKMINEAFDRLDNYFKKV
jgi:aminotransferase